tara:strand:+ start:395 stop:1069 length:675 start_codon:yes stop_codon:yes gene_type:complete
MYKIKQKAIYKLEYEIKLNRGLTFKTNTELKGISEKVNIYEGLDEEKYTHYKKIYDRKTLEIHNYNKLKREAEERLKNINLGLEDEEFQSKYDEREKEKLFNKERKLEKKESTIKSNKQLSQKYYKNSYQSNRKEKFLEKDLRYHYNLFEKKSRSLPQYIKRNLKYMPNNKGYIWKGVWFFGAKPEKEGDNTMSMYEICGKKTYIRTRDENKQWTITLKQKSTR